MKCDMCDSEASVFLTQIIDGKMTQVNLCDKCSKEQGVTDPTGFQLADFLLGAAQKKPKQLQPLHDDTLACPACGFTRAHLKKIGRMGCPECYRVFAEDLESMLRAMHKGTRHIGKTPAKRPETSPEPSAEAQVKEQPKPETSTIVATPPVPPPVTTASLKRRLANLKAEIEKAVADERYEDAARLRDQVKEIEAKLA